MKQSTISDNSIRKSIKSGLSSVFHSSKNSFYELEHLTDTKRYKSGKIERIILNYIVLGRGDGCQIRYSDDCGTVSRQHAAIIAENGGWKLVHLSCTNSTYVGEQSVLTKEGDECMLKTGDVIRLSQNGPALRFIAPKGSGSLMKSMSMTTRMRLFNEQALRPYRKAMTAIGILLIAVVIAAVMLGIKIHKQSSQLSDAKQKITQMTGLLESDRNTIDSLLSKLNGMRRNNNAQGEIRVARVIDNAAVKKCEPYVYSITVKKIIFTDIVGEKYEYNVDEFIGTGFMLEDGKFVTAHHVIEPWYYFSESTSIYTQTNAMIESGYTVYAEFEAMSPTGDCIKFTDEEFKKGKSIFTDTTVMVYDDYYKLKILPPDGNDYAYIQTSRHKGLPFDSNMSNNLQTGVELTVLGYPGGYGVSDNENTPIWGNAIVAKDGLIDGRITTNQTATEGGNSGGPVFYTAPDGRLVVVGIVSAGYGQLGFHTPISKIK